MAVFICQSNPFTAQIPKGFTKDRAVTPLCVVRHSPMLVQHANSLRAVCTRIASTARVYTQAVKRPSFHLWKDNRFRLQRAHPLTPLNAKTQCRPAKPALAFLLQKTCRKRHYKNPKQQLYPERTRKWTNTEIKTVPENTGL